MNNKRLYKIWHLMIRRCENSNDSAYHNYGARGISVFEEWKDYLTFEKWAISSGYNDSLTIERKDVEGNYCPSNCTWIPKSEQSKNRRCNHYVMYEGKQYTLTEICKLFGLDRENVRYQENRIGNAEEAINYILRRKEKYGRCKEMVTLDGQTKSLKEWCETYGISQRTVKDRVEKWGWDIKSALETKPQKTSIFYNGENHSLREWASILKVDYDYLRGVYYCNQKNPYIAFEKLNQKKG